MKMPLITNNFIKSASFLELFDNLKNAAAKYGIELERKTNCDFYASTLSPDFVLPKYAVFWDKDVYLAKYLESCGVRLFNSADAIACCDDKGLTHLKLNGQIPMPETYFAPKTYPAFDDLDYSFSDKFINKLGLPLIIKENFGSFGNEVYLCETKEEVYQTIDKIGVKPFIFQKFVRSSVGKDVRVYVIGKKAVGAIKRTSKTDFRANVARGGEAEVFNLTLDFKAVAEKAAEILNCDFCGVDLLFGEDGKPILIEVNSNAHFKGFTAATGINVADKIMEYVFNNTKE